MVIIKYIYGLDLSMSSTGYAIFDKDCNLVKFGHIETTNKDKYGVRLKKIVDELDSLIKKFPVDELIMERGFSRFSTSTQAIYRVHGVVNYVFADYEQTYYPPKQIKACLKNGNATKKDIQKVVFELFPDAVFSTKEVKNKKTGEIRVEINDDETDAVAIGLTYFKLK